jgi:hypothetical protein
MSDFLGDIGRAFITPQYYIGIIIGTIFIIFVTYYLYKSPPPPGQSRTTQLLAGGGMIVLTLFVMYMNRRSRDLVRTNNRYARIVGFNRIFRMFM